MKKLYFIFFLVTIIGFNSCKKEEKTPDYAKEAEGIYQGSFSSGTFQQADYVITIEASFDNEIKVKPEDNNGIEFTVKVTKTDDVIISYDNKLNISNTTGIDRLRFNKNGMVFDGYRIQ